jgi:hypothetical protein
MSLFSNENIGHELTGLELNRLAKGNKFYKIININKNHNGFQYKLGYNKDTHEFVPISGCLSGGLYFTTIDYIFEFTLFGCYRCEIQIPNDARCFIEKRKIKADRFIILEFIFLKNITEFLKNDIEFIEFAVHQHYNVLKYIHKQPINICMQTVGLYPEALEFINRNAQTYELCSFCLSRDGTLIRYVINQTYELCLIAIKNTPLSIKYIRYKNDDLYKYALDKNPSIICCIENPSFDLCKYAIDLDNKVFCMIDKKYQYHKLCKYILQKNPAFLKYINNQTHELCEFAIKKNTNSIIHVKNQTYELCKIAMEININVISNIKNYYQRDDLTTLERDLCATTDHTTTFLKKND